MAVREAEGKDAAPTVAIVDRRQGAALMLVNKRMRFRRTTYTLSCRRRNCMAAMPTKCANSAITPPSNVATARCSATSGSGSPAIANSSTAYIVIARLENRVVHPQECVTGPCRRGDQTHQHRDSRTQQRHQQRQQARAAQRSDKPGERSCGCFSRGRSKDQQHCHWHPVAVWHVEHAVKQLRRADRQRHGNGVSPPRCAARDHVADLR